MYSAQLLLALELDVRSQYPDLMCGQFSEHHNIYWKRTVHHLSIMWSQQWEQVEVVSQINILVYSV